MRRTIILAVIGLAIIIAAVVITREVLSYKQVSFDIKDPTTEITIYDRETGGEVAKAKNNDNIKLKIGSYHYTPHGERVDRSPVNFSVDDESEQTVTVDPAYSTEYLATLAKGQDSEIKKLMSSKYPAVMPKYNINRVELFNHGEVAGALLTPKGMDNNNPDAFYRAALRKKDGNWQLIGKPQVVLTKFNSPDVDMGVMEKINNMALK